MDPSIESVEFDIPIYALENIYVRNEAVRKLAEDTPYGIPMVLEDLDFWSSLPPPSGSKKVCVADTGYGYGHEDLPTGNDVDGTDSPSNGKWNGDGHGHGSHCSGTVAALGGNNKGVVGVIPDNAEGKFQLLIGKALSDSGSGSTSGVMEAIQGCVNDGADVVSLSLGGGSYSATIEETYREYYEEDNVLFVAAAGNGGSSAYLYPASYKGLMSVAAIDSNENKASFSQYNDQVEIAAPGVSVKSTIPTDNYASWSGTSMATPHVAGVAGLLWMYFPNCKNYQIREAMLRTAKDLGDDQCDTNYGHGLVQAKAAYELLESGFCDTDPGYSDPVGGCAQLTCSEDSDCDDGDDNTKDTCENGACKNEFFCTSDSACDDGKPCTVDICTDNTCSNEFSCSSCNKDKLVTVDLTIDSYGQETRWEIEDSDANVVFQGGDHPASSNTVVSECFDSGTYKFTIEDDYGDGICCNYGNGGYIVSVDGTEVASGGDFGSGESKTFEVSPGAPTTPSPVTSPTVTPPTPFPTHKAPTPYPTQKSPTSHPTHTPPTLFPTHKPPTPFPTSSPTTSPPTPSCGNKNDPCETKADCCDKPNQKCKRNKKCKK